MQVCQAVITGMGVVSPAGVGASRFWEALLAGVSLVRRVDLPEPIAVPLGAPAPTVNGDGAPHDRHVRYALLAAEEAIAQAALTVQQRRDAGVVFGTTVGGAERIEAAFRRRRSIPDIHTALCFGSLSDILRRRLGMEGVNLTISTGCTAGLDAIGAAVDQIQLGRSQCVVTGASDATLVPIVVAAFDQMGALSRRVGSPRTASRPFDSERDGFVLGEGAAAFIVEDAEHARKRRQPVLVRIRGWSSVCSGFHMTNVRPDGRDLGRAMGRALRRADLACGDIDLIDAHGTSTRVNDLTEAAAIAQVFGPAASRLPLTAQKSIMGHALGASNALEVAGVVRTLIAGVAPAVANVSMLDPQCRVAPVRGAPLEGRFRNVLKLSSSFSGIHSALILSREAV